MNKGRTGVDNFVLSKPTWEIMKFISEITDFISQIIFGAIFREERFFLVHYFPQSSEQKNRNTQINLNTPIPQKFFHLKGLRNVQPSFQREHP